MWLTPIGWQNVAIFTHFDTLDFIPASFDVTNVLDPRHQNALTGPLADFREFLPLFKPLNIYLNLVCKADRLAECSDFDALDFIPAPCDVTNVLDPRH